MELIFGESSKRSQCGCEVLINDQTARCTFSSSQTVTLPAGLSYFDGRLKPSGNDLAETLAICQNHKPRIQAAFKAFLELMAS